MQQLLLYLSEGLFTILLEEVIDGDPELVLERFINIVKGVMQMVGKFLTKGSLSAAHKADEIDSHIKKALLPVWTEAQRNEF